MTRAQDDRRRSLDETLASARLDVELVGKSVAETERLRTEHELLAEVRRVAAANNVKVDQAEVERIREIAAETAKLRAVQQAREFIRTQDEELEKLRMEQQLIGVSEGLRNRLTAAMEAELEIRRLGTDANGQEAENIRRNAEAMAAQRTEIERQAEAWDTYRSASEGALDGVIDKLSDGDLKGAMKGLLEDGKEFGSELVGNTVKNAMFNDNLPTLADAPAFLSKLFGGADNGAANAVSSVLGQSVGAMNVNAGIVNIMGGAGVDGLTGKGGLLELLGVDKPGAKDIIRMPLPDIGAGAGSLDSVTAYIQQAAAARGIDPATALKVARSEGLAPGVWQSNVINSAGQRETSYGPYQLLTGGGLGDEFERLTGMRASDPAGVYKQVDFSLDHAAKNGWGAWYGADKVGVGKWDGLQGAQSLGGLAEQAKVAGVAIDRMATTSIDATKGIGTLGAGAGQLGHTFANAFPAAPAAPAGGGGGGFFSWLSSLFGGGGTNAFPAAPSPAGLWEIGGFTGFGNPKDAAGLVHKEEYVFSAPAVRAIGLGNLDAMHRAAKHGYAEGGYAMPDSWRGDVSRSASGGGYGAGQPFSVQFINRGTPQEVVDRRQESDGRGGRLEIYELRDQMSRAATDPNSSFRRTLGSMGAEPQRPLR